MNLNDITDAMSAIVSAADAENRSMTTDEMSKYEALETDRANAVKSEQLRSRHSGLLVPKNDLLVGTVDSDAQMRSFEPYLRGADKDGAQYRAQGEGVPSEGGFLVPMTYRDKLVECQYSFGGVAAVAENITTSTGSTLEWPTVSDGTSNAAIAGRAEITPEHGLFEAGGDLVFGSNSLSAYKYTTSGPNDEPVRVSVELLQDSRIDVQGLIARHFANRIARKQALDFALGSGVGEPLGILTKAPSAELATANSFANAANGYAKLLEIESLLDSAYLANARWVFNRVTWNQIRSIVDADGRPLIQANSEAGIGRDPGGNFTLLGYPVTIDESFPSPADDVTFMAFGDIREAYVIRRVADFHLGVDPYTRMKYGQVEYVGWERADATIQNGCAYVTVKGKDA